MTSPDCLDESDSEPAESKQCIECVFDYCAQTNDTNSTFETVTSLDIGATSGAIVINYEVRFAVYTTLSVACLVFNAVSLAAMSHVHGPRTVHHRLLTNLAACDVVGTALLWMYYNSPYIFPRYKLVGIQRCLFIGLVLLGPFILSLCASSLALLILAGNQYLAICNPLFAQTRITGGRAGLCVGLAWLIAAVAASIPAIVMLSMQTVDEGCTAVTAEVAVKSLEVCAYILAGLIVVIVLLYARIYREVLQCRIRSQELRQSVRRVPVTRCNFSDGRSSGNTTSSSSSSTRSSSTGSAETNYKAFVTTILLTGTLVVFWLPYMVFNLLSAHINLDSAPDPVIYIKCYVIDFLPMLNFITDPIIYGIRMRDIRRAYRRLPLAILPSSWFSDHNQFDQRQSTTRSGGTSTSFNVVVTTTTHRSVLPTGASHI